MDTIFKPDAFLVVSNKYLASVLLRYLCSRKGTLRTRSLNVVSRLIVFSLVLCSAAFREGVILKAKFN